MTRTIIERIAAGERDGAPVEYQLVRVGRRWEVVRGESGIVERHDDETAARRSFARRVRTTARVGGMPRRAAEPATERVTIRLTTSERAQLQAQADARGQSLGDWMRSAALAASAE